MLPEVNQTAKRAAERLQKVTVFWSVLVTQLARANGSEIEKDQCVGQAIRVLRARLIVRVRLANPARHTVVATPKAVTQMKVCGLRFVHR